MREDLQRVAAVDPFSVLSLCVAGPEELARYGSGAPVLTGDRMTLEFSAPREIHRRSGGRNAAALLALRDSRHGPPALVAAEAAAGAPAWRHRALMFARSDVHTRACDDFVRALTIDPDDAGALDGFVRTVALSKLLAAGGDRATALALGHAELAIAIDPAYAPMYDLAGAEAPWLDPASATACAGLARAR